MNKTYAIIILLWCFGIVSTNETDIEADNWDSDYNTEGEGPSYINAIGNVRGCVIGDCDNGEGTFIYIGGNQYSGEFKNGLKHGYGTEIYPDYSFTDEKAGLKAGNYEGEWRDDVKWGFGKFTFATGEFYIGEYRRDERRGIGLLVYTGKTKRYIGEFRRGEIEGFGFTHRTVPQLTDSDNPIINTLVNGSSLHFINNDSLHIIESGAFSKDIQVFNEPLDSVILYLFNKYPDQEIILQHLITYNKELVTDLLEKKNFNMECGPSYGLSPQCPYDWVCNKGVCNEKNSIPIVSGETETDCSSGLYDCLGKCDGKAVVDECGICGGAGIPSGYCDCLGSVLDCAGDCDGTAIIDDCETCCGGVESVSNILCSWEEYPGVSKMDRCGVCDGDGMSCFGCTDPSACDYNPDATQSIGACDYSCWGCMNIEACNYNPTATINKNCTYAPNNYDCNGLCITAIDCEGVCGGNSVTDECGACNGDGFIICKNGDTVCLDSECKDRGCDLPINSIRLINNKILYSSEVPIYGFDININGALISSVYGGDAKVNNFTSTIFGGTIMGRSFGNSPINAGCGTLIELIITNNIQEIVSASIYNTYGIPQALNIIK